ncbi:TPA: YhbY family RNA-binding protein [Candidatus Woesearchaeota archaeon]|nr:YhbY family RNA-binding protein [Candidatus Woesearchaeota archaeon]HIH31787.1 YhbY family RNA-binding protein [Candidatus Woesearchaeota archaeon]HIH55333.1 YhbY family RNA-binding protein [Candidatus Woesearchaeota archaeon]HIJ01860.1 YhbY family RNA-binding protein [Candidatus Woesearchaeota archaeon]HIJ13813.1 YhbY family RNA-binding protein [Candidatus Woesearchaeota archaeon]
MEEKLRKLSKAIKPDIIIGKNGLTDASIKLINDKLKHSAIVKIKILKTYVESRDMKQIKEELLQRTSSKLVHAIGFTVALTKR